MTLHILRWQESRLIATCKRGEKNPGIYIYIYVLAWDPNQIKSNRMAISFGAVLHKWQCQFSQGIEKLRGLGNKRADRNKVIYEYQI